jgi:ubiquinone/menaquinone biosynthesis C-methylase UbiE
MSTPDTKPGQAVYSRWSLALYDAYVLGLSCNLAWRCPAERLLAHYDRHVSGRHLDVGVGTGYFLDRCRFPVSMPRVCLLDLNAQSLAHAARRISRYAPRTVRGDVLGPLSLDERFESVGLGFLLHCLPGSMVDKATAITNLARVLEPHGVLFGSTILGAGVEHNALGRRLMAIYNAKGIFGNAADSESDLRAALEASFTDVTIERVGTVALFSARGPRAH